MANDMTMIGSLLKMLDVDSDGVVSFEDFMACCLEDQSIKQSLTLLLPGQF